MNLENFHEDILAVRKSASVEAAEHFAFTSNVLHQTIVLVLSSNDIVFWKFPDCDGKNNDKPVFRLVPWLKTKEKKIQAIAFHPITFDILENGVPLLIVTYDSSLYILPTEKILNGENLSQIDITEYSLSVADFIPSAAVWWSCTSAYHRDIAIIGGTEGKLIFYSLSKDCFIISTDIVQKHSIYSLDIYSNPYANYSFLLITDDKFQHWKLLLEKQVCGVSVLWLPVPVNVYSTNKKELSSAQPQRSHFQAFRTLSAEKFNLFKQKLNESSNGFFKSSTEKSKISSSDKIKYNTEVGGPLLQSCECYGNSLLTLQQYQGKCILTGYSKLESIFSLYLQENHETMVVTHKLTLNPVVTDVLLTDTFIFVSHVVNSEHRISIFSTQLTKSEKIKDGEFNEKSVIQTVNFDENEIVLKLYRMRGESLLNEETEKAILQLTSVLHPNLRDSFVKKCTCLEEKWRNGCLAVTNKGLYQIFLRENPWLTAVKGFVHVGGVYVSVHSQIFELNLKVVLELTVNQLIIQENYKTAASLYFFADRQSIKGILKLASLGRVNELLDLSKTVLADNHISQTDRLQVSNLTAMCYMEKILREPENNENYVKNFIDFLNTNNSFDEDFILKIMKSSRLFKFMRLMATTRGLYVNVVNLIVDLLQSENLEYTEFEDNEEFWSLMNEKVLITGMLIKLNCSPLEYVRSKINVLTKIMLQRFWEYYDPTVPVLKQPLTRLFQEAENSTPCETFLINWITNFLIVHIVLYRSDDFDLNLLRYVSMTENLCSLDPLFPDLNVTESEFYSAPPILSCGFSHVGNVRNSELFVWGQTSSGCLGNGPSLSACATPSPVNVFSQLKIAVTHVSCGRRHTLALTISGMYSWGCSKYGQLGIGHVNQSQYPHLIESFHSNVIIYISAGQYHSLAIDLNGRLWSWGWAVYGQLGHDSIDDEFYPRMVDTLKTMTIVSACGGQIHSVVLTDSGKVWTFGSGSFGQLGTCAKIKKSKPVELFTITEKVTMIATGYFHNLALSVSNKLYTWGINPITLNAQEQAQKRKTRKQKKLESSTRYNADKDEPPTESTEIVQTTPPLFFDDVVEPYHIPLLVDTTKVDSPIQQISCGGFHYVLLTKSGNVYTWGRNMEGQLGVGNRSDVLIPTFVNVRAIRSDIITTPDSSRIDHINSGTIVQVSCGRDFTVAVTNEGRVFGWGCNNDGQLGVIPEDNNSGSRSAKEESHGNSLENKILSFIRSSKRVLRIPQALSDTVDYPEEIKSLSRCRFVSINRPSFTQQLLQRRLPFNVSRDNQVNHHVIRSFSALMKNSSFSKTKLLHYALECFSGYYDVNLVKNTCIKHQNYQAAAKICHLNFKFFEAFHYSMKALLSPLSHFDEQVHLASEFISDASCLLKCYLQLNVMLNENKTVIYFLHQALSLWIDVKMPMSVIENVMFEYLEQITYPLSVLLFCGDGPSFFTAFSKSDIDNTAASSPCAESDNGSYDSSIMKNWFEYTNDESSQDDSYRSPTSNDITETNSSNEFRLHSPEFILEHFSADFRMKLCSSVTHFISTTKIEEYREFIGLLNDAVFAPSILKNDNRNANEVLSFVLHVLRQQQNLPKDATLSAVNPYIHVPFNVLKGRNVNQHSVLAVFSCGHNYVNEDELALEVTELMSSLDRLRLFSMKLVIGELFGIRTDINFYPSCCPKCLLLFIVFLSKNAQNEY